MNGVPRGSFEQACRHSYSSCWLHLEGSNFGLPEDFGESAKNLISRGFKIWNFGFWGSEMTTLLRIVLEGSTMGVWAPKGGPKRSPPGCPKSLVLIGNCDFGKNVCTRPALRLTIFWSPFWKSRIFLKSPILTGIAVFWVAPKQAVGRTDTKTLADTIWVSDFGSLWIHGSPV